MYFRPLKPEFENKIENIYDALIESVDFSNTRETVRKINNFVSQKTQGQITDVVTPDEILKVNESS
jgi:serine protease inhibitor